MKRLLQKLYEHIDIVLLVCLCVSFTLGIYNMATKMGGPTTMDYVAHGILGIIIIGLIYFLASERKRKTES
ncbi:hypothetical protein QUF99_24730 [Bacillus sp. DX4.1]|uniref:hypothetical protein n=1 Tax=Bacillus sp. DX4.1 TaxID=3055867 RepID=UPI0025A135EA|nr:hypothetical protein [Bacillus sp. DX4.1]MDM5190434.1 hypothetical protein [Bacillus sp. DX4.1]